MNIEKLQIILKGKKVALYNNRDDDHHHYLRKQPIIHHYSFQP
jgi:hypothetical protein